MKKIAVSVLLLFAVMFSASKVYAENISESTARQLGAYFMSVMSGQQQAEPAQLTLVYTFMNPTQDIPSAWIFNVKGQGFVIMSASDFCYPVLGYSTEGMIDETRIAPALLAYFGEAARRISYAQDQSVSLFNDTKGIAIEWNELYNHTLVSLPAKATYWLMDEAWDQGENYNPTYNLLCPHGTDANGNTAYCYTGCVATAMSMIMHYWKYPVTGKGYIGYNCYINEGTELQQYWDYIDINLNNVHYDYDKMPNQLTHSSTQEEINAVALLNYHAGVSVKMGYGFDGSGTQSTYVPDALTKKFKYESATYVNRTNVNYQNMTETPRYSDDEWIKMCTDEIVAGHPIYYSAYSRSGSGRDAGGHAFVLDGFHPSNANKAHFNWGWGGAPNTWSDLRNGDLSVPASYGGYNFNFGQAMVYRILPPADSIPVGINDVAADLTMPAYPNPASDMVTIPYQVKSQEAQTMSVYTIEGRLIETVELSPAEDRVVLNVSNYAKGVYVYRIGSSSNRFVVK